MNAFSLGIDAIFADPNLATDALYTPPGGGTPVPCRAIMVAPDEVAALGQIGAVVHSAIADVRVAELAELVAPLEYGTLTIPAVGGVVYSILSPQRDQERLVWRLRLVEP